MASKASSTKPTKRSASAPENVETFLASLDHPFKQEILALRQIILDADPSIAEDIKWNAPSFRTSEYFATFHLRAKDRASAKFRDLKDIDARRSAFANVIRQWIKHV